MKLISALAVSVMLLMGQSDTGTPRSVTAVRHWSLPDVTRVAVAVSGPFKFHSDRLHNPERVYFDIANCHVRIDSRLFYAETVGDTLLEKIRVAENTPGTTRIVLELNGNVATTPSILTNPDRLIIELRVATGNPLRTENPPTDPAAHPAADSTTPPISAPTATVKPAPRPVKPLANIDAPGDTAVKTPVAPADPAVPESAGSEATSATPPAAPGSGETHTADPGPSEVAKAARHTSAGTNSLIRALGLKINRVVIDPGHGGHDQGPQVRRAWWKKTWFWMSPCGWESSCRIAWARK